MPARKGTESPNAIGLWRLAGMTVLSLLAIGAVAAAWGCAGAREPEPSLARVDKVPYRSLDVLKASIVANSGRWQTLQATCDVTILNPSIPAPSNALVLRAGRIAFDRRSRKVSLAVRGLGGNRVKLVGDGSAYEATVLEDVYRGSYGDSLSSETGRIHLMPDDLADALDPANLFWERALTLTHGPLLSQIHALDFITEPAKHFKMTGTITIDRRRESNLTILKYDEDGSVRVQIVYLTVRPYSAGDDESLPAEVPTRLRMDYPQDPTIVLLQLTNIELNTELDADRFMVRQ